MRTLKKLLAYGAAASAMGALGGGAVEVALDPSRVLAEVSPDIYGLGMEDVNHEIYGGLDAQRLYGESFEEPARTPGSSPTQVRWNVSGCWEYASGHPGELVHDTSVAHWGGASQAMKPNGCVIGMCNRGLGNAGIPVWKGRALVGCLYARGEVGALEVVMMEGSKAKRLTETVSLEPAPGETWRRIDFRLMPTADEPKARFVVLAHGYGTIWIDDVYLADEPTNEFGRIGCREDVVAGMQRAGVNFLRWGGTMCNAEDYNLGRFDGMRKPYRGLWHRYSSGGFGPREFVRLAAAMNVPCAVSISAREVVAEAVRFAEELKAYDIPIVVEIGNEECIATKSDAARRQYGKLFRSLVPAMRRANPKLTFASALWWPNSDKADFELLDGLVEYWDLHPYFENIEQCLANRGEVRQFLDKIRGWNPKTTMKAAVFEENGTRHDLSRALCHALMLEEIRAAGKDVLTSCPANALQVYGQNDNGWDQGNVFMTPDKVWLAPCAWAQRMARDGHREILFSSQSSDGDVHVSATRDREGASIVLHFVNVSNAVKKVALKANDNAAWSVVRVVSLSGKGLDADNGPDAPDNVIPVDSTADCRQGLVLKPYSYTVVTLGK